MYKAVLAFNAVRSSDRCLESLPPIPPPGNRRCAGLINVFGKLYCGGMVPVILFCQHGVFRLGAGGLCRPGIYSAALMIPAIHATGYDPPAHPSISG